MDELLKESMELNKELIEHYTMEGYNLIKKYIVLEQKMLDIAKKINIIEKEDNIIEKEKSNIEINTEQKTYNDLPF